MAIELLSEYGTVASIILRIVAAAIILFFCIPLQLKEARVYNGIRKLRILLLSMGTILLSTNLITLWILINVTVSNTIQPPLNSGLQVINALAYLALAIIGHLIYHQQYTDESMEAHRITDGVMNGDIKITERRKK